MAALNSTTYTNQGNGRAPIPVGPLTKGALVCQQVVIAVPNTGAGTALNDTLGLFRVPKGAIPRSFTLKTDRLDTNGSPLLTIDVGWAGFTTNILSAWAGAATALVTGQPNVAVAASAFYGVQFAADTDIFATIHAAAATKAAGNLVATIEYEMGGLAS